MSQFCEGRRTRRKLTPQGNQRGRSPDRSPAKPLKLPSLWPRRKQAPTRGSAWWARRPIHSACSSAPLASNHTACAAQVPDLAGILATAVCWRLLRAGHGTTRGQTGTILDPLESSRKGRASSAGGAGASGHLSARPRLRSIRREALSPALAKRGAQRGGTAAGATGFLPHRGVAVGAGIPSRLGRFTRRCRDSRALAPGLRRGVGDARNVDAGLGACAGPLLVSCRGR